MRAASIILCMALAGLTHAADTVSPTPPPQPPTATRTAYMGVVTSAATPALREQLGLPGGLGVAVEAVENDSPAECAGLQVHDVITKMDDQLVINVHQLGVLVQLHKAGDTINLAVVRHGKPTDISVQLADRLLPPGEEPNAFATAAPHNGRLSSIVTQTDGAHIITLTNHGEDHHVRIADTAGKVLYDGPLNTPEDHARVPADCRTKVDAIERSLERYKQLRNNSPAPKPPPPAPVPSPGTPGEG